MICPNCGVEIPDGSYQCTSCGTFLNVQNQGMPNYDAQNQGMPNYDAQYQGMPNNVQYQPAPVKKKTGLIIGIISGVAAIAVIIVLCVVFLGKGKLDGRYVCKDMEWLGLDLYIEIDGDEFKLISEYDEDGDGVISDDERDVDEGTVEVDGDIVTLMIEDTSIDCAYDAKEGTITMDDGIKMVFKKQ